MAKQWSFIDDSTTKGAETLAIVQSGTSDFGTGIGTDIAVDGALFVNSTLYANNQVGSAGSVLASTGTGVNWIAADDGSTDNAVNVGTNLNSGDADNFLAFMGASSSNNPVRVDADLKYNPARNTLTIVNINSSGVTTSGSFVKSGGTSSQFLKADGSVDSTSYATTAATGIVPIGSIVLWYGSVASIPSGWSLCNGTTVNGYATPDLRNQFVVGAGDSYSVADSGGSSSTTLTTSQLPSHDHSISVSGTTSNKSLTGGIRKISEGFNANGSATGVFTKTSDGNSSITGSSSNSPVGGVDFDGSHDHTFSASGTSGSTGSGSSIENRPPYYALAYIMRTS